MEGVKRLFAESKRSYLCVLILVLLCSSIDCFWICSENISMAHSEEYIKENMGNMAPESLFAQTSVSFGEVFSDRLTELDGFYIFFVVLIEILIILAFKGFAFLDERAREFRTTWPVKNWIRELYEYVSVLTVVWAGFLFQLVVLLLIQTQHNNTLLEMMNLDGKNEAIANIIFSSNESLVYTMLYYLFSSGLLYTWIYFGITLAKNPVIGVAGALLMQASIFYVCDIWIWRIIDTAYYYEFGGVMEYSVCFHLYKILEMFSCLIYDFYAGDCYNRLERTFENSNYFVDGQITICSVETWLLIKIIIFALLVIGIIWIANKKELSKGKLLYVPIFDYVLSVYVGIVGVTTGVHLFVPYDLNLVKPYDIFASVLVGVILMVLTFMVLHPCRLGKRQQHLEVK